MVCNFVRNALCEYESLLKEIKFVIGCYMHFRVPFLMVIGISWSINLVIRTFCGEGNLEDFYYLL